MKILTIRGENLASLYGPFELPLDRGAIGEVGLFSISGPTGSGKSTLMDALCLGLFGETSRLGDRGRNVLIGRPDDDQKLLVDAGDERNLLSHGTGEGFAEVDFEGGDGKRYRARWAVHRAGSKPGGRLQGVRRSLSDLDTSELLSSQAGEVDALVEKALGFSFAEFSRAVVLPQFEFTAFLHAKPDERANILERVTGTDIYTRLSKAAQRRASEEHERLRLLEQRVSDAAPMPAEQRDAVVASAREAETRQDEARRARKAAEEALRWHAIDSDLGAEVAQALAAAEAARRRNADAEPHRAELLAVESAQDLRGPHDRLFHADAARETARLAATASAEGLAAAEAVRTRLAGDESAAAAGSAAAAQAHEAARPALAQARVLDTRLSVAAQASATVERAARDAGAALERAVEATVAREGAVREAERLQKAAQDWLRAHPEHAALAGEWPRWESLLRDLGLLLADSSRTRDAASAARKARDGAGAEREALQRRCSEQEAALARLSGDAERLAAGAAGRDPAPLQSALDALHTRQLALGAAVGLAERACTALAGLQKARGAIAEQTQRALTANTACQSAEARLRVEEARASEAREALRRVEAALDLSDRRAELVDGQPCPLCGALEHPYAADAPGSLLTGQREATAAADRRVAAAQGELQGATSKRDLAGERLAQARKEETARVADLAEARSGYAAARARGPAELPEEAEEALETARDQLISAEGNREAARIALAEALAAASEAKTARAAADTARGAVDGTRRSLAAAEVAVARLEKDVQRHEAALAGLESRSGGIETDLEVALGCFPDWRLAMARDATAFQRRCATAAAEYARQESSARAAGERLTQALPGLEVARAQQAEKAVQAQGTAEASGRARAEAAVLQAERGRLFGGQAAEVVEAGLRQGIEVAEKALDSARRRLNEADKALAAAAKQREGADAAHAAAQAAGTAAAAALDAALAARGLTRPQLAKLLDHPASWIAARRDEHAELQAAVGKAEATLGDRERRLEGHRATARPDTDAAEAGQRAQAAGAVEAEATRTLAQAQVTLGEDDRRRTAQAGLGEALAAQRKATDLWASLDGVIGHGDGKEFRVFAQGLALDALLQAANAQLRQLARRYQLMRVPRTDLELQIVDRDLGDEIRSVNCLSGGESFLVSLALALGLSALSTRTAHARTLFIDEGFGTLDRDTLELAMDALEGLGASGRTIGVISHVPELHERLGVRVSVERVSAGRSRVVLPEG